MTQFVSPVSAEGIPSRERGWYPDPAGSGGSRFWDGEEWGVDVHHNATPEQIEAAQRAKNKSRVKKGVWIALGFLFLFNFAYKQILKEENSSEEWLTSVKPTMEAIYPATRDLDNAVSAENLSVPEVQAACSKVNNVLLGLQPESGIAAPTASIDAAARKAIDAANNLGRTCSTFTTPLTDGQVDAYNKSYEELRTSLIDFADKTYEKFSK
jgi:hypothetical protein